MSRIVFFLMTISIIGCVQKQDQIIRSNNKNIKIIVNGKLRPWRISPEINPDRIYIYCDEKINEVVFQTDIDTSVFKVFKNDSIRLIVVLNSIDTAKTEIIGLKDIPQTITNNEKLFWLSQLWSEAKYNFVNIDKLEFDFDSLFKAQIPDVLNTQNDYQFYQELKKFLASLKDGHTGVYDRGQFYHFTDYIQISFLDFDKKIYITNIRKIAELDSTWLGAELIEIENLPVVEYLEEKVFPYISASTDQHLWMQGVAQLHNDFKDKPFIGTIRKRNGSIEKIVLQRNGEATRTPNDEYWGPGFNYSRNIIDFKWLNNNIAVVDFNRFSPTDKAIEKFDKITKELERAQGLIVDLRKNGGGSTAVAIYLLKHLVKNNQFQIYGWETRISDGLKKANGIGGNEYSDYFQNKAYRYETAETVQIEESIRKIDCPTIILIDRYTFSAAEDFLVNIYELEDRPTIIGEETGGSTGSPLVIPGLPGGGYARICARRINYPISGESFVNKGIKPDIEVKQTIDDYLNEKDVVLERAILELKNTTH